MKFLRLYEPLLTVLFENDDIIAFDKPYGFNTHTNDSKADHSEFIEDGLIEILEKQRGHRLHIIHRLDQTTTGVIIFGKSQESAKKYAEYFFDRKVKKTYWFVTAKKSINTEFVIADPILHKGKELEAKTELRLQKRNANLELWEARPFTGRNHQIRIHAKAAGISILGDPKYDGKDFFFLCLHNHKIQFPNDIVITSVAPIYFENLELLEDHVLAKTYFEIDRRRRLFGMNPSRKESFRWVHNKGSVTENDFSIDQHGERVVVNAAKENLNNKDSDRILQIVKHLGSLALVKAGKSTLSISKDGELSILESPFHWIAGEGRVQYELHGESGSGVGLVLSQRLQRHWVLHNSKDKKVLNLFAQQGGYALNAALGGAIEVTSVESNKNMLSWARRNFEINAVESEQSKFLCRDSVVFLKQALAKNQQFDLIICDAPTFLRGEKGVFKIESDLTTLVKNCVQALAKEGTLLLSISSEGLLMGDILTTFKNAQREIKFSLEVENIQASFDFELPHEKTTVKSFLIRKA